MVKQCICVITCLWHDLSLVISLPQRLTGSLSVRPDCCLLSLATVGLFRKYISFLELPFSLLLPSCLCCCVGFQGYRQAKVGLQTDSLLAEMFSLSIKRLACCYHTGVDSIFAWVRIKSCGSIIKLWQQWPIVFFKHIEMLIILEHSWQWNVI